MKFMLIVAAVAVLASGCASLNSPMVNPNTGQVQNCEAFGFGFIGVPMAYGIVNECEEKLTKAGFVKMDEYQKSGQSLPVQAATHQPGKLSIVTDPPDCIVYAGQTKDNVTQKLGLSPYNLNRPPAAGLWRYECYKATKDGYFDSAPECFEPTTGDRNVKLVLSKKS